jgi:phosphate transport system ATP-binding protein
VPTIHKFPDADVKVRIDGLSAYYGKSRAIQEVTFQVPARAATAIIGPSGCGKSTLVRCLNRMHEVTSGARASGQVLLDGTDIYQLDPAEVRHRVGMVFQKPNPFPTMSIYNNVCAGLKLNGVRNRKVLDEAVVTALKKAALWDEVREQVHKPGAHLSGGQQQRLCIARALAVQPEVILMDEPCSALDPIATAKIEQLIRELKSEYTIVVVTHNMQQAARVADYTAFMYLGQLIEFGSTAEMFETPKEPLTEQYLTGRFG